MSDHKHKYSITKTHISYVHDHRTMARSNIGYSELQQSILYT